MERVTVIDVLDGHTLVVWPPLVHGDQKSQLVRVNGIRAPQLNENRGHEARCRLMFLLMGCIVNVTRTYGISNEGLVCDVEYSGQYLAQHFPDYAIRRGPSSSEGTATPSPPAVVANFNTQ